VGAIKILKKSEIKKLESEDREKMIKQLSNEIRIQHTMHHPNVIKLYTFFHDADSIYLFM
jgi:serine/threonine protein kinase